MPRRFVNEKTLELNITHEGMVSVGIGVVGFTQQQESKVGADVLYPCIDPFIIQFKAAKNGTDNSLATFHVNNNKKMNQHRALDAIAKSGVCQAYYAFPLVVSDPFLATKFGSLLDYTIMIDAQKLTGTLNWVDTTHSVTVQSNGQFKVESDGTVTGEGFSARGFFEKKAKERKRQLNKEKRLSEYIGNLIEQMENAVKEAQIAGQSEHTATLIGTDIKEEHLGYLQLPIRVRGLREKSRNRFTFR